jgi:hypothetical protein
LKKRCTRSEASSNLHHLQHLETAILSLLWDDILERLNATGKQFQAVNIDLGVIAELYASLTHYVNDAMDNLNFLEQQPPEDMKARCKETGKENFKLKIPAKTR